MVVAALSTVVEWYDFTLYLYFSTVLARVFFGTGPQSMTETLGGFAIAYLMRPVGALVFGHFGDRLGRRRAFSYDFDSRVTQEVWYASGGSAPNDVP